LTTAMLDIPLGASMTEEEARAIYARGEGAVIFALLGMAKKLAEQQAQAAATSHQTPATPSGMKPPYQKPTITMRGKKRPGRKKGHPGSRRETPERIDRHVTHRAKVCPDCGGPLKRCAETRTRHTEDIPANLESEVTEHTIHRDWRPNCKKKVEPAVTEAMPNATLGNRTLVLSAWLHYGLGATLAQLVDVFNFHLAMKLTPGGLIQMWRRLARIVALWHEEIQRQALESSVLHADETGWRVNGKTHWLWCFATENLSFFMIDRSRGSPALLKMFTQEFDGALVTDFWAPYHALACAARQKRLAHLLRDLARVEKYKSPSPEWKVFAKKLRRLIMDAIRLRRRREKHSPQAYASRGQCITKRLQKLIDTPWTDKQAKRLIKRFRRHQDELFTFLEDPDVPFDNNLAERSIRPAVILRKNSNGNRSHQGTDTQAILMSVFFTLKKRGHNPVAVIRDALTVYLETGKLPPLPEKVAANG